MAIGIICEYNPFHNGHIYHLKKIKELYRDEEIILVLGGNFLQRGNLSIISKEDKTKIALEFGINLVVELPFAFATQGADLFAKGAISILKKLKCKKIVFGSETSDIDLFTKAARVQLEDDNYNKKIKGYLSMGINYPSALSKALKDIIGIEIEKPNDILALSYIREIIKQNADITPVSIKRTNDYHGDISLSNIASAESIREALKSKKNVQAYLPEISLNFIDSSFHEETYFKILKYKIITEKEEIKKYQTVDEGIENRILKNIDQAENLEDLIKKVKTKRYTYNKISRMFTHILCSFTKEEALNNKEISYIRILGFDCRGKEYINNIKKEIDVPIISNINKNNIGYLKIDIRAEQVYNIISDKSVNIYAFKPIINNMNNKEI